MELGTRLASAVGKNINAICTNKFHDPAQNHCAHFVSHILGMAFSFNCREHGGGREEGANVRVHEIFAQCPKVGKWADADTSRTQLAFVTLASNVNLANKRMVNIPQKHIGIFHQGKIYHYGNSADKVVTDTAETFLKKFETIYSGRQGLFFGWIPGEDLLLNVSARGSSASAEKKFDLPNPKNGIWRAKLVGEGSDFLVGREVNQPSKKFHGIRNDLPDNDSPVYQASDYRDELDHWANLLEVTGACESGNRFNLVNTYDRAKFTFGFYQLAAHTPRDNLILLFRRLADLPGFASYFPELVVRNGHLHRVDGNGSATDLEQELQAVNGEQQIMLFMNYLNPLRVPVDRQEVLQAARLIHWCNGDPKMRRAQVHVAGEILQQKMITRYARKLDLDGRSDLICAIVADIFHQGRSDYATVRAILSSGSPEAALLTVNDAKWSGRNRRLAKAIKDSGQFGNKIYKAATNEFVQR